MTEANRLAPRVSPEISERIAQAMDDAAREIAEYAAGGEVGPGEVRCLIESALMGPIASLEAALAARSPALLSAVLQDRADENRESPFDEARLAVWRRAHDAHERLVNAARRMRFDLLYQEDDGGHDVCPICGMYSNQHSTACELAELEASVDALPGGSEP